MLVSMMNLFIHTETNYKIKNCQFPALVKETFYKTFITEYKQTNVVKYICQRRSTYSCSGGFHGNEKLTSLHCDIHLGSKLNPVAGFYLFDYKI